MKKNWNQETLLRDKRNSLKEEQSKRPQHQDQSKRVCWHKSNNWARDFSISSKVRQLRSVHIIHIKQPWIKFQISELCFPSHYCQQNNKSTTKPGMTQWIPNNQSICTHREWANEQNTRRRSTDSSLKQHIQHWFAKGQPQSIRLSNVRIWP